MFKAIARYMKAVFALLTGGVNSMRESLNQNKHVIAATFDEIADDQISAVNTMQEVVSQMLAAKERKVSKIEELSKRIKENGEIRDGAKIMVMELKEKFDLTTPEGQAALKNTSEYKEAASAYENLSKEIEDDENTLAELELAVEEDEQQLSNRLVQLGEMKDQIEKIKREKRETIADVEASKQEIEINNLINGISESATGSRLQELRELRQNVKAKVKITRTLAGTETKTRKAEFKKFVQKAKANSEFDELLGLGKTVSSQEEVNETEKETTKLPE